MATLPKIECASGQWTDVSTGMAVGVSYVMQTNAENGFLLCEKATSPLSSDSSFFINPKVQQTVLYQSVKFWVKPLVSASVTVEIQEAP